MCSPELRECDICHEEFADDDPECPPSVPVASRMSYKTRLSSQPKGENLNTQEVNWREYLETLSPCISASMWVAQFATAQEAWEACDEPEWMVWLLHRTCRQKPVLCQLVIDCISEALETSPEFSEMLKNWKTTDWTQTDVLNYAESELADSVSWLITKDYNPANVFCELGDMINPFQNSADSLSILPDFIRKTVPSIMTWVR